MTNLLKLMKQLFILTILLLGISCSSFSNEKNETSSINEAKGIKFYYDYDEALIEAKKTGKPLFVDAYATWCGPCKWMSAKTFTQEKVGEYFNANFINVKIDAEKGKGRDFATKYGIRAYPTLFFISPDDKLIHKAEGALDGVQLLQLGEKVISSYK